MQKNPSTIFPEHIKIIWIFRLSFLPDAGIMFYHNRFRKKGRQKHKETKRCLDTMCEIMEKLRNEARTEGRREGSLATLSALVREGILTLPQAARMTEMTEDVFAENMKNFPNKRPNGADAIRIHAAAPIFICNIKIVIMQVLSINCIKN